jgi:hypothetical protein
MVQRLNRHPSPRPLRPQTLLDKIIKSRRGKQFAAIAAIAASVVTVVLAVPDLRKMILKATRPEIELSFYSEDLNGQRHINHDNTIQAKIPTKNLASSVVRVPIRLALKNAGKEELSDVRVKIKYDPTVHIYSEALQKVLDGSTIYEHPVGHIDRQDDYVFLEKTDELLLRMFTAIEEMTVIAKDGIPNLWKLLVIVPESENPKGLFLDRTIPIQVSILDKERKPITKPISINLKLDLKFLWPPEGVEPTIGDISGTDIQLSNEMANRVKTESPVWSKSYDTSREISYYSIHAKPDGLYLQLLAVNKDLRLINASTGGDGKLDYQILIPADGSQIAKLVWHKQADMIEWPEASVK